MEPTCGALQERSSPVPSILRAPCELGTTGLPLLQELTNLTALELHRFEPLGSPAGVALPPNLQHLAVSGYICGCGCTVTDVALPPGLSTLGTLRHLSCDLCSAPELLAAVPRLHSLTALELSDCDLQGQSIKVGLSGWEGSMD